VSHCDIRNRRLAAEATQVTAKMSVLEAKIAELTDLNANLAASNDPDLASLLGGRDPP
jgi:hypothetical protein